MLTLPKANLSFFFMTHKNDLQTLVQLEM